MFNLSRGLGGNQISNYGRRSAIIAGALSGALILTCLLLARAPLSRPSPRRTCPVDIPPVVGNVYRVTASTPGWPRTLVIILAETRASELTWSKFQENVLVPLKADLAVCASTRSNPDDPFMRAAKYKWIYREPDDWAQAYDEACRCNGCWRKVLQIREQLFGGILDDKYQHGGSAGILIFFRWYLLQNLIQSQVAGMYDYFMVTRSDYYYLAPHPRVVDDTDSSMIWIPEGEDYEGITDRHILVPRLHLYAALSLMEPIIENPEGLYNAMRFKKDWNLEQYIQFHFDRMGVLKFVRRFPRVMFAVRGANTSTRWRQGDYHAELGMIVKYSTEYDLARKSVPLLELP